jgi:hypothetical protein
MAAMLQACSHSISCGAVARSLFNLTGLQTHSVLDDVLYNIVHDLLMKTHRDEKQARASTAAIRVEKLAADATESSESKPDVRIETDAAIYEDEKVTLKGNPLKTSKEVLCPRCHLPRLLYPTDGKGSRKPDPSIIYCKKHPYIEKPGYDIYGQTWVAPGPGRGKKKKDMEKKLDSDTPGTPTPEQRPPNVLAFPSATCSKCKRCILVTRLNNHMGSCIGNSGRNASRAAAQKISNGNNGNSQNDNTPPSSQKGTPLPGSRAGSPRKRDGDEFDEDTESDPNKPKKKMKPTTIPKKVILKTKTSGTPIPIPNKNKIKTSSQLSFERKADEDGSVEVAPKKIPVPSPAKKLKITSSRPPVLSSPASKNGRDDAASESSGTLSSPPQH